MRKGGFAGGTGMRRIGFVGLMVVLAGPAMAEQIRIADGGSIFGGGGWTITPNDHVRYDAYSIEGGLSTREGWVWDNEEVKQGHITFAIPGAFATASAVMTEGLAGLGPAPDYQSQCNDAGSYTLEVDVAGLDYTATMDNCAGFDGAPADVRAYYDKMRGVGTEVITALGLDRL
jgi:hypothetical protein